MVDDSKALEIHPNDLALFTALRCAIYSNANWISQPTRFALVSIAHRLLDGQQVDRDEYSLVMYAFHATDQTNSFAESIDAVRAGWDQAPVVEESEAPPGRPQEGTQRPKA